VDNERYCSFRKAGRFTAGLLVVFGLIVSLGACGVFGKHDEVSLRFPFVSHSTDAFINSKNLNDVVQPPLIPEAQWVSLRAGNFSEIGSYALAGITSHHLLAAWYIDRFFIELAEQRKDANIPIKTFIVLSPRHFELGSELAAFSYLPWDTGLSSLAVNRRLAEKLRRATGSKWDPYSFAGEHGIGVPASFIKKHFPNATMVPVVLEIPGLRMDVLERLAKAIIAAMKKDRSIFLLVSSDFSHGGGLELTRQRDAQSETALHMLDSTSARRVCCDNNAGMVVLGSVLEKLGRGKGYTAAHSSGFDIVGIQENITSYFFCYF
jgi:hypothetical protein